MQDKQVINVSNENKSTSVDSNLDIIIYSNDERKRMVWSRAFDAWISHLDSPNTKRVYEQGWKYFLQFSQKAPWDVGRSIIVDYINYMREERNLSDATIHQRLASLSSFFDFVCRDYTIIKDGREIPLYDINPASSKILRKRVTPYQKANWLSKDEVKIFLNAIPRNTLQGIRDYAMFLMFILTGRRNSEVRNLQWGDIAIEADGAIMYHWSGKYVEDKKFEMAKIVYDAIVEYLKFSGRLENIQKEDYIFIASNDNALRLPNVKPIAEDYYNINRPLSLRDVGRLLKKYLKLAMIEKDMNCHGLRHTAVVLRRLAKESIEDVSRFLGHANYVATANYLHCIEGDRDRTVKKVERILDL